MDALSRSGTRGTPERRRHEELLRSARSGELVVAIAESRRLERLAALAAYRLGKAVAGSPAAAV